MFYFYSRPAHPMTRQLRHALKSLDCEYVEKNLFSNLLDYNDALRLVHASSSLRLPASRLKEMEAPPDHSDQWASLLLEYPSMIKTPMVLDETGQPVILTPSLDALPPHTQAGRLQA